MPSIPHTRLAGQEMVSTSGEMLGLVEHRVGGNAGCFEGFTHTLKCVDRLEVEDELLEVNGDKSIMIWQDLIIGRIPKAGGRTESLRRQLAACVMSKTVFGLVSMMLRESVPRIVHTTNDAAGSHLHSPYRRTIICLNTRL